MIEVVKSGMTVIRTLITTGNENRFDVDFSNADILLNMLSRYLDNHLFEEKVFGFLTFTVFF